MSVATPTATVNPDLARARSGQSYPRLNGAFPSFAEIKLYLTNSPGRFSSQIIVDIRSISYDDECPPEFRYMTGAYPVARTRGQYKTKGCSIEFGLEAHRTIADRLIHDGFRGGFGDVRFDIMVTYGMTANDLLTTDLLQRVRIIGNGQRNSVGGKELTTTCPLSVTRIQWGADHYLTAPEIR